MDENPYGAPQGPMQKEEGANPERKLEDDSPSPKILIIVAAIIGVLMLLAALFVRLASLLWSDYPAD